MDTSWVEKVFGAALHDPAGNVRAITCELLETPAGHAGRVSLTYRWVDARGGEHEGTGRIYLPALLRDEPGAVLPLVYNAGYEMPDANALTHLEHDRVVATPCTPAPDQTWPGVNPLSRGPNMDVPLAHLARGLRCVDPAKVLYVGGSGGGYACLLVAAEAFPVAGAMPLVPVVNVAYEAAYGLVNLARLGPPNETTNRTPFLAIVPGLARQCAEAYGDDLGARAWLDHSPVGQLDRITGPVSVVFGTADLLVPIEQVGVREAAATLADLPGDLVMAAEALSDEPAVAIRLVEALGPERVEVCTVPVPEGAPVVDRPDPTLMDRAPELPMPDGPPPGKQWLVTVVDEGSPILEIGHFRHAVRPDLEPFAARCFDDGIGVDQLTAHKLEQLLDRYLGVEWMSPGFVHLDGAAAERADVVRGLQTFCSVSPRHAQRFADLYAAAERRALPDDLVSELTAAASPSLA
jgi:hypothetical protein